MRLKTVTNSLPNSAVKKRKQHEAPNELLDVPFKQWFMTKDFNLNPEPPICAVTLWRIASSFGLVRPEKGMTKVLFNTMFRWCPRTSWKCIARDLLWTNPFKLIAEDVYDNYRTICCVFMHNIVLSFPQMPIWSEKKRWNNLHVLRRLYYYLRTSAPQQGQFNLSSPLCFCSTWRFRSACLAVSWQIVLTLKLISVLT